MSPSRRHLLRLTGTVGAAVTAGCSSLPFTSAPPSLTLRVVNRDTEPHDVRVDGLRAAGDAAGDPAFDAEFDLPAASRAADPTHAQESRVAPSRRYLVRVGVGSLTDHYHFYPDCRGGESCEEILRITVESPDDGGLAVTFAQFVNEG